MQTWNNLLHNNANEDGSTVFSFSAILSIFMSERTKISAFPRASRSSNCIYEMLREYLKVEHPHYVCGYYSLNTSSASMCDQDLNDTNPEEPLMQH